MVLVDALGRQASRLIKPANVANYAMAQVLNPKTGRHRTAFFKVDRDTLVVAEKELQRAIEYLKTGEAPAAEGEIVEYEATLGSKY